MVTPKKIIPESITYLGDVPGESVVVIEVQTETMAEAEAALAAEQPQVAVVGAGGMPQGSSGFIPAK